MIEPPVQSRVGRILEVDDCIYVAVKHAIVKKLRGLVCHAGELKICTRREFGLVEPAEKSRRRRSVETVVVIENSHQHGFSRIKLGKPSSLPQTGGQTQVRRHGGTAAWT